MRLRFSDALSWGIGMGGLICLHGARPVPSAADAEEGRQRRAGRQMDITPPSGSDPLTPTSRHELIGRRRGDTLE